MSKFDFRNSRIGKQIIATGDVVFDQRGQTVGNQTNVGPSNAFGQDGCSPSCNCVELRRAARALVMSTTGYFGALELGFKSNGEDLHRDLRKALGISKEDWEASEDR